MEQNNPQQNTIKDSILEKISKNELSMRPKWNFMLKIAAVSFLLTMVLIVSVFICNFIFFHISESGRGALLGFGPRGYLSFIRFFPWELLALDIVLVVFVNYVLKKFEFAYKRPGVYIVFGLLSVVVISGVMVSVYTPFNRELDRQSKMGHLPQPLGQLYDHARRPPPPNHGICRCEILTVSETTLTAKDTQNEEVFTIFLPADSPKDIQFRPGEIVFLAGDINPERNTIHLFGIQKVPEQR